MILMFITIKGKKNLPFQMIEIRMKVEGKFTEVNIFDIMISSSGIIFNNAPLSPSYLK